MAQPELDRLLINNIADLDAAAQHIINELMPDVGKALDELADAFMRKSGWAGKADWSNEGLWLAPEDWRKQGISKRKADSDDFIAYFGFANRGEEEPKEVYWLTQILGIGDRDLGLRWCRNDVKTKQWRKAVGQQTSVIEPLRARGFEYQESEGSFFLPIHVDQAALAQAVGDESPELALAPFTNVLQSCADAKPDFDALLAATKEMD
jgi:hypothetical protein